MSLKTLQNLIFQQLSDASRKLSNKSGQNIVEYVLILATVVTTAVVTLGPEGIVTKEVERVPGLTIDKAQCVARQTCFREDNCVLEAVCGNRCCEPSESKTSCPEDCEVENEESHYCGDGIKDPGETCGNCPQDIPECSCGDNQCDKNLGEEETCPQDCTVPESCGDNICDEGEDCNNCEGDCGSCAFSCDIGSRFCNGGCIVDGSAGEGEECCESGNCASGICVDNVCQEIFSCTGDIPGNTTLCPGAGNPTEDTAITMVESCGLAQCEYRCNPGDSDICSVSGIPECIADGSVPDTEECCESRNCSAASACVEGLCQPLPGECVGTPLDGWDLCSGDDSPETVTSITLVAACGTPDCEYTCDTESYRFCDAECVPNRSLPQDAVCCENINCVSNSCIDGICQPLAGSCGNGIIEEGEVCDGIEGLETPGVSYFDGGNWYVEVLGDCQNSCTQRFRSTTCTGAPDNALWWDNSAFLEFCDNGVGSGCNNWTVTENSAGEPLINESTPVFSETDIGNRTCDYFCADGTHYCLNGCIPKNDLGDGSACCDDINCQSGNCQKQEGEDAGVCAVSLPACTGAEPDNAEICAGDDSPAVDTLISLVESCGVDDCEYICNDESDFCSGECVVKGSRLENAQCCSDENCASNDCDIASGTCRPDTRCTICGTVYNQGEEIYKIETCIAGPPDSPVELTFSCGDPIPDIAGLGASRSELCAGITPASPEPDTINYLWEGNVITTTPSTDINSVCPNEIATCGNDTLDSGEECDDGNTRGGDGCSTSCSWETKNFICLPTPEGNQYVFNQAESYTQTCVASNGNDCTQWDYPGDVVTEYNPVPSVTACRFTCTEGLVWTGNGCGEQCEDISDGAACGSAPHCSWDAGAGICVDAGLPICANGVVETGEECDDGNKDNKDGCSKNCDWETKNFACSAKPGGNETQMNTVFAYMQTCVASNGVTCTDWIPPDDPTTEYDETPSSTSCQFNCSASYVWDSTACVLGEVLCGNGSVDSGEECDDGNTQDGDGCSKTCGWETRIHICPDALADETTMVFNTVLAYVQTCTASNGVACTSWNPPDDPTTEYNTTPATDSCRFRCADNYIWNNADCIPEAVCGDNLIEGAEECDDGNQNSGDGCSVNCNWETKNFLCNPAPDEAGTQANTVYAYNQICMASDGTACTSWNPPDDPTTEYNETPSTTSCQYICADGYNREGSQCVPVDCGNGRIDPAGCTDSCLFRSGHDSNCNAIRDEAVCNGAANCQWNAIDVNAGSYCAGFSNPLDCLNEPYEKCTWSLLLEASECIPRVEAQETFDASSCGYQVQCDRLQGEVSCSLASAHCIWDDCIEECDGGVNCTSCKCNAGTYPTSPPSSSCANSCLTVRNEFGDCCPSGRPLVTDCSGHSVCIPCVQPGETWTGNCSNHGPLSGIEGCEVKLN